MFSNKSTKERTVENHLRLYKSYKVGIKNCEKQLNYIMPTLVSNYGITENGSFWFISNDTEKVAIDRIESKRALDLREEIEQFKLITDSIDAALDELTPEEWNFVQQRYFLASPMKDVKTAMGYSEEKSIYRIRRRVLDKLLISLNNLLTLK